jgi:hypothetical protein
MTSTKVANTVPALRGPASIDETASPAARLLRSQEISAKAALALQTRTGLALNRFAERSKHAFELQAEALRALPATPWAAWTGAAEYAVDFAQRSLIFGDTLRQRGNNFIEHARQGLPPVLHFDYEMVMDGRLLERRVNYALVRIVPPKGVKVDAKRRPYVIIDPRGGHGPGIGGFKDDSQVGVALRAGHPVYFVIYFPDPEPGQTLLDVCHAEREFVRHVRTLHWATRRVLAGSSALATRLRAWSPRLRWLALCAVGVLFLASLWDDLGRLRDPLCIANVLFVVPDFSVCPAGFNGAEIIGELRDSASPKLQARFSDLLFSGLGHVVLLAFVVAWLARPLAARRWLVLPFVIVIALMLFMLPMTYGVMVKPVRFPRLALTFNADAGKRADQRLYLVRRDGQGIVAWDASGVHWSGGRCHRLQERRSRRSITRWPLQQDPNHEHHVPLAADSASLPGRPVDLRGVRHPAQ